MIRLLIVIALTGTLLISGCANFQPTQSEKELGQIALNYQVIKAVNNTKDPLKTKQQLIAGINAIEDGLNGDLNTAGTTAIVEVLKNNIKWEVKTPEDEYLHQHVYDLIQQDLNDRFNVKVGIPLTDQQKADIKTLLDSMKDALGVIK